LGARPEADEEKVAALPRKEESFDSESDRGFRIFLRGASADLAAAEGPPSKGFFSNDSWLR
jgi:hypothetical protein